MDSQKLYDQMYRERKGYTGPVEIFRKAIEWFSLNIIVDVVEFGCGIGEFAELLFHADREIANRDGYGQGFVKGYTGYDVSGVAIENANKLQLDKRFQFIQKDIVNESIETPPGAVYVSFQTLEHLPLPDGDRKIIEKIPSGARFMFSVPLNSLGKYHLRLYKGIADTQRMYADLLTVRDGLHFKDKHKRILVDSTRKS
jgi:SAM-dependent methyltransferase